MQDYYLLLSIYIFLYLCFLNKFIMSTPGISEWVLIILAVLILFGGRKIPEFMKGLGKGIREFNDAKNNVRRELEDGINEAPRQPSNTKRSTTNQQQQPRNLNLFYILLNHSLCLVFILSKTINLYY